MGGISTTAPLRCGTGIFTSVQLSNAAFTGGMLQRNTQRERTIQGIHGRRGWARETGAGIDEDEDEDDEEEDDGGGRQNFRSNTSEPMETSELARSTSHGPW